MTGLREEVDGRGVARLTLDRAARRNALDDPLMDALTEAVGRLVADPGVRAVVPAAEGSMFCGGGHLGWMRAQMEAGPEDRAREARRLAGMLAALDSLPKPMLAEVQADAAVGVALGLGAAVEEEVAALLACAPGAVTNPLIRALRPWERCHRPCRRRPRVPVGLRRGPRRHRRLPRQDAPALEPHMSVSP